MEFKDIIYNDINTDGVEKEKIYESSNIQRQAIKINRVEGHTNTYVSSHSFMSKDLVTEPTDRIALFCNYLIPASFTDRNVIHFVFHINGESIPVVPVNSNKSGIKIIKQSEYLKGEDYEHIIQESIKSARLEIIMETQDRESSPMVSNVKILFGSEVKE